MLYIYAIYIYAIYMLYIYAIYIYAIYMLHIYMLHIYMLYIYVNISPIPPLLFDISCFLDCLRYPATRVATGKDGFKKASTARMQLAHQFHGRFWVDFPRVFPLFFYMKK